MTSSTDTERHRVWTRQVEPDRNAPRAEKALLPYTVATNSFAVNRYTRIRDDATVYGTSRRLVR